MINTLLFKITAGLPTRLIEVDDKPYLERYYVGTLFGVTFYLHRFVSADRERHLHNHPWRRGGSVILAGAYDEEVVVDLYEGGVVTNTRRVRWFNRVDGNHFHRIANAAKGTWTLFFHGERSRVMLGQCSKPKGWGFLENDGEHVYFKSFPSANAEWWRTAPTGRDSGRVEL